MVEEIFEEQFYVGVRVQWAQVTVAVNESTCVPEVCLPCLDGVRVCLPAPISSASSAAPLSLPPLRLRLNLAFEALSPIFVSCKIIVSSKGWVCMVRGRCKDTVPFVIFKERVDQR